MAIDWNGPTPTLDEFLAAYREDDNEWWRAGSGHHLNLFDEAIDRLEAAQMKMGDLRARGRQPSPLPCAHFNAECSFTIHDAEDRLICERCDTPAQSDMARLEAECLALLEEVSLVRECWKIDMRAAREAEAKVAAVTALAEERHDHGLKACPTCYWQTRILSALGGMG